MRNRQWLRTLSTTTGNSLDTGQQLLRLYPAGGGGRGGVARGTQGDAEGDIHRDPDCGAAGVLLGDTELGMLYVIKCDFDLGILCGEC